MLRIIWLVVLILHPALAFAQRPGFIPISPGQQIVLKAEKADVPLGPIIVLFTKGWSFRWRNTQGQFLTLRLLERNTQQNTQGQFLTLHLLVSHQGLPHAKSRTDPFPVIADEIVIPQGTGKLIYFQKLRFEKDGHSGYRFTYYVRGHKPSRRGRWVFGQYSLMIPQRELALLLRKARARGWKGL